ARIAYFFEAGHKNGALAERGVLEWAREGAHNQFYASHTFARKQDVRLLQAADLLVWQAAKFMKDKVTNTRAPRKDFMSLMEHSHVFAYIILDGSYVGMSIDNNPERADLFRDAYLLSVFSDGQDEPTVKAYHRMFAQGIGTVR